MYVFLINDDNTMMATKTQRITQRSNLVNEMWFLSKPTYNIYEMAEFTVSIEYVLPVSRTYRNEILTLSEDMYNGHLKYVLPFDTKLTAEAGQVEILLTFLQVDSDEAGNLFQRVRKITGGTVEIAPIPRWSDLIPDEALSALDQRILKTDAQLKALSEMIYENAVDGLDYDKETSELQLRAGDKLIGNRVNLSTGASLEDGIPVMLLNDLPATVEDSDAFTF